MLTFQILQNLGRRSKSAQHFEWRQCYGHFRFMVIVWIIDRILRVQYFPLLLKNNQSYTKYQKNSKNHTFVGCTWIDNAVFTDNTFSKNGSWISPADSGESLKLLPMTDGFSPSHLLNNSPVSWIIDGPFGCVPIHNWKFNLWKILIKWIKVTYLCIRLIFFDVHWFLARHADSIALWCRIIKRRWR